MSLVTGGLGDVSSSTTVVFKIEIKKHFFKTNTLKTKFKTNILKTNFIIKEVKIK